MRAQRPRERRDTPPPGRAEGALAEKIRQALERRGASFFADIAREAGGMTSDVRRALWDMIWAGEVTNDTFEPLRAHTFVTESTFGLPIFRWAKAQGAIVVQRAARRTRESSLMSVDLVCTKIGLIF